MKRESVSPLDLRFDPEFANTFSQIESYNKHHYRPNSYLHKWWARRCGSTLRLILKALVEDSDQHDYYAPGGLEGKVILDPMMGGGTTLHEAIRLGANVIGADLDPIPVLQARATLTEFPLEQLEAAFETLYRELRRELAPLFRTSCPTCEQPTGIRFTLYGVRRACECGPALLVDSVDLRTESDGRVIRICSLCRRISQNGDPCRCSPGDARMAIVEKSTRACPSCGARYREESQTPYWARFEPLAIVGECAAHGLFFRSPAAADHTRLKRANAMRPVLPPEEFAINAGPKSADLLRRGVNCYADLFSSRQLLYLQHAAHIVSEFDWPAQLNLALLVSTSLELNSMLCGYKGASPRRPGAIRHAFAHHAYSFPYTALENNPLYPKKASGTLQRLFHDRIRRARHWAAQPVERRFIDGSPRRVPIPGEKDSGEEIRRQVDLRSGTRRFLLMQGSSASLDLEPDSVDAIVTDPPYFDSVQYSDLAAFFHVWLRRMLPEQASWDLDLADSAVDPHRNDGPNGQYTRVLSAIFAECHRVLQKKDGRLIFTFHHWNPNGWTALTLALKRAGFVLLNRYIVHAENPASVHIANLNALTHDAILVLAPGEIGVSAPWSRPRRINKGDSFAFCQDCSSVLGWMLDRDLKEIEIEKLWFKLLA